MTQEINIQLPTFICPKCGKEGVDLRGSMFNGEGLRKDGVCFRWTYYETPEKCSAEDMYECRGANPTVRP